MSDWPEALSREARLWIYHSFVDRGRAPSPRELCERFHLSPSEVESLLRQLERRDDVATHILPNEDLLEPSRAGIVADRLEQDRGLMEYDKRSMQNVETFRVIAREIPASP